MNFSLVEWNRLNKAVEIADSVKKVGVALYEVPSQKGRGVYTVDLAEETCTCPDFTIRGIKCKHIVAVALNRIEPSQDRAPRIADYSEVY